MQKIFLINEDHRLLLKSHMSIRSNRLIEIALKLLTKQIHIVWNQNTNQVITLLNVNVIEAFDTISHFRLVHYLKKRKISLWIINWVSSFMQNKSTTLIINRRIIKRFAINTSISQNSFILSLLYFFYNADLLKMCDKFEINTRSLKYADDVNRLTYVKSTKKNCRTLKRMHELCEKWANLHEFVFASTKYELIHFTRNSKKFNMIAIIIIRINVVESKTNIWVLSLQINIKLKWNSHVRKIQKKMIKQFMILTKISISIWSVIFSKTRVIYIFVICSIMIYVFSMWHTLKKKKIDINNKLTMLQNKCLKTIASVFRIIFVSILEVETYIISMNIHFNQLQTQTRLRLCIEFCAKWITDSCRIIINKLRKRVRRRRKHRVISEELKHV